MFLHAQGFHPFFDLPPRFARKCATARFHFGKIDIHGLPCGSRQQPKPTRPDVSFCTRSYIPSAFLPLLAELRSSVVPKSRARPLQSQGRCARSGDDGVLADRYVVALLARGTAIFVHAETRSRRLRRGWGLGVRTTNRRARGEPPPRLPSLCSPCGPCKTERGPSHPLRGRCPPITVLTGLRGRTRSANKIAAI